jgi:general secretion pathway protein E
MSAAIEPVISTTRETVDDREGDVCAWLVARGRLKDSDLGRARRLHEESVEGTLTTLMARLGLVSERDLAEAWAELLQVPLLAARDAPELPPADLDVSLRFLKQQHVVPVQDDEHGLTLIVADPADPYPLQAVELAAGRPVALRVGLRSEIDGLIERYYGTGRSAMGTIVENLDGSAAEEDDVEHLRDLASEAPVIRLVNLILQRAVEQRASDVHVEPFENRLKVRYRIDGVLHEVEAPPSSSTAAVISRVKIMARLNIAERRLPQDGRIQLRVQGKELDLRVSTVPTSFGESVVMRILDRESVVFDFAGALRSIVRQDPDVIMIGEMRDLETCRIAIQSALTGHLVLSTLHTNSAAGGLTRLLDMGVEDYLIASTVNAIVAQRLVRRLDPATAEAYEPLPEMVAELGLDKLTNQRPLRLYRARASAENPSGFRGRLAIIEQLTMNDALRRLLMQHADASDIERAARQSGMRTMYEDGLRKVLAGLTTVEEVLRVTQEG